MVKTVEAYMEQHRMIMENDVVVAGVSGGADSVCLFLLLEEYCRKKNAGLVVVHMNHGIREDAGKDAEYVRALCEEFHVPFHLFEKDINRIAAESGVGTEEAGRAARYEAFEKILEEYGGTGKIAVAHNKGDQAETVLFHLFRGSNIAGLSGIAPVRGNVIRPLLCVGRNEIEQFLKEKGRSWCIDFTNEENTYTRNKIRNVVLPYVEQEICEQASVHIADAAGELGKIRQFMEETVTAAEKDVLVVGEGRVCIRKEAFGRFHEVIQKQLILRAVEYMVPGRKDIGAVHITDIFSLFHKAVGKQIHLPYGLLAENLYEEVVIRKNNRKEAAVENYPVMIPGSVQLTSDKTMEFKVFSGNIPGKIPQKTYTKWFDYDKIISCLELRHRKTGDYLIISGEGNHKSIKEYFIEEKIPREERDKILLLADGSHILWVIGKRISEYYKVTEQTKNILQVTFFNDEKDI